MRFITAGYSNQLFYEQSFQRYPPVLLRFYTFIVPHGADFIGQVMKVTEKCSEWFARAIQKVCERNSRNACWAEIHQHIVVENFHFIKHPHQTLQYLSLSLFAACQLTFIYRFFGYIEEGASAALRAQWDFASSRIMWRCGSLEGGE